MAGAVGAGLECQINSSRLHRRGGQAGDRTIKMARLCKVSLTMKKYFDCFLMEITQ